MLRKFALLFCLVLFAVVLAPPATAQTPLTRAVIQTVRNQVQLIPRQQTPRPARIAEEMRSEDAISTGLASLAELRFNDGSLARVGESAVFRFVPNTRNFRLSNGNLLLLVPPGRGTTQINTPNAAAGIRGSALFVRYLPNNDTTIVAALTNSGIEVANRTRSQRQGIQAGQLALLVRDRLEAVYNFDLNQFYETNELAQDLSLNSRDPQITDDRAIREAFAQRLHRRIPAGIAAVRAEIQEALAQPQPPQTPWIQLADLEQFSGVRSPSS
ncbi:FecR family protein [Kamptonema cortianum]|uniref:FecR family protein n=1 Tax=Geitlerinema calcuttense NRMC-F 0142 TaxID=2922238 RepID=A0ABT7M3F6_9CYAN|nr:FecR family protein [Geitlerinema calcuttense]MDK3160165.1 FecR family protein [Kamptonema cortianum]MDL5057586.1 FecR family protein [Geitlerinema calcuttense NRMC-F 0142]